MARRLLLVTAAKEEEVLLARKHLGYDQLIIVAPQGEGKKLAAAAPHALVEEVPGHDLLACLDRFERLLAKHRGSDVRCAVDGGTSAMSAGAFLACLSQGVEAHFLLNKAVRLPVLHARPIARRFTDEELAVLRSLDGQAKYDALAQRASLSMETLKAACLSLRKQGALESDASGVSLTDLGRYYRSGLGN
jgi:hypothetical protein